MRTSDEQKKPISGSVKSMKQADKVSQREHEIAQQLFHSKYEDLGERERKVARHLATKTHIARNTAEEFAGQLTFGQRLASRSSNAASAQLSARTSGFPAVHPNSRIMIGFLGTILVIRG